MSASEPCCQTRLLAEQHTDHRNFEGTPLQFISEHRLLAEEHGSLSSVCSHTRGHPEQTVATRTLYILLYWSTEREDKESSFVGDAKVMRPQHSSEIPTGKNLSERSYESDCVF